MQIKAVSARRAFWSFSEFWSNYELWLQLLINALGKTLPNFDLQKSDLNSLRNFKWKWALTRVSMNYYDFTACVIYNPVHFCSKASISNLNLLCSLLMALIFQNIFFFVSFLPPNFTQTIIFSWSTQLVQKIWTFSLDIFWICENIRDQVLSWLCRIRPFLLFLCQNRITFSKGPLENPFQRLDLSLSVRKRGCRLFTDKKIHLISIYQLVENIKDCCFFIEI